MCACLYTTGFPRHTYSIKYSAPGDPALAKRVSELLDAAGLPTTIDKYVWRDSFRSPDLH